MKVLTTSVDIGAPPERVWHVLTDFPAHPQWNPFIQSISGRPATGETLTVHIKPPGGKGMTFRPKVLVAEPNRELRWKGKLLLPGLFDGEHFFELLPSSNGTRLNHGEKFSGLFVEMMGASSFEQIKGGFNAMNEALRRRAEA